MARTIIPNSHYSPKSNTIELDPISDDFEISTTWIINNKLPGQKLNKFVYEVRVFCKQNNLIVQKIDNHHLKVTGSTRNINKALQINLQKYTDFGHIYHASKQPISILKSWNNKLVNILGLNTDKIAFPYCKIAQRNKDIESKAIVPFTPPELALLYNFPTNLNGLGQKIGIIELGGGYILSDITTYLSMLNITDTPNITAVSVDGAVNDPNDPSGASVEVVLDIEVIVAIVPKAEIRVYFAPNSDQGFYNAINQAANDGCKIISISWGATEKNWFSSSMTSYNTMFQNITTTKNVTVFAAAGDNGSSDGEIGTNVDFPASSPYVVACGGTRLIASDSTTISQETVWNVNSQSSATGGGISKVFTMPNYQASLSYPLNNKRGVPDISGAADPNTGYVLYMTGETIVVGGTSAVSPLWSALMGKINQSKGSPVGFLQPIIYASPTVCRDITQGNNGAYSAAGGWDPCTGYGSPNGQSLLNLITNNTSTPVTAFSGTPLSGSALLTVNFTDASINNPTSWLWNFGDNTTSAAKNPSHIYSTTGTYTVTLTATNNNGSNTLTKTNYITAITPPNPIASFTGSPLTGNRPLTVTFNNTSTNATSWSWNFGDNTTSTSKNPSHTYANAGTYTVRLTATNVNGSNTLTRTNYITVNNPQLKASFTGTPLSGKRPLTIRFADSSIGATSWSWNFGDNTTSTSRNPIHVYSRSGLYTVRLTVRNGNTSNTLIRTNYVNVSN